MDTDTAPDVTSEIESVLQEWRTKALNVLLTVAAVLGLPTVLSILLYLDPGQDWRLPFLSLLVTYLLLVGLAAFRRLNIRLRGWGLLWVGYMAAILTLMQGGLAGTGRTFLMVLPVLAITLIGVCSGLIAAALGFVIFTVFAIFAHLGWLESRLMWLDNHLDLGTWVSIGITTTMLLTVSVVLLERFKRLQVKTVGIERRTAVELARTYDLLEQYNRTLEQKVEQRPHASLKLSERPTPGLTCI